MKGHEILSAILLIQNSIAEKGGSHASWTKNNDRHHHSVVNMCTVPTHNQPKAPKENCNKFTQTYFHTALRLGGCKFNYQTDSSLQRAKRSTFNSVKNKL